MVGQEETQGIYGEGVHNIIEDDCGNCLVLSTWRTHKNDLQLGIYKFCIRNKQSLQTINFYIIIKHFIYSI